MRNGRISWIHVALVYLIVVLTAIMGCGGGGGTSVSTPPGGGTPPPPGTISGSAVKGPVAIATVTAFAITTRGVKSVQIGTGQTDGQGNFSISVGDYNGAVLMEMRGGTFMDEATGAVMPMQSDIMTCVIPEKTPATALTGVQITPLTTMADSMAVGMAGNRTALNIATANTAVGNYFMVSDILRVQPMDPTKQGSAAAADQNMRNYGMVIAAMSQYAKEIGMPFSSGMVTAMASDASDGVMNGLMGSTAIAMGGGMNGSMIMSPTAGTSDLAGAMGRFINSPANRSGVTLQDMQGLINKLMSSNGIIR